MFVSLLFCLIIFTLLCILLKGKYNELYWNKRGVVFYKKNSTGGPYWQYLVEDKSVFQILREIYLKFEGAPAVGLGSFVDPTLFVTNLENIQHVVHTDFHSFNHRGIPVPDSDILGNSITLLHGAKWRLVRHKMSPLFTAAKLKNMYYIIDKSAQDFVNFLKKNPEKLKTDTYNTLTHFCNAAIAAAVFGIGTESTFESPFHKMAKNALTTGFWKNITFALAGISERLFKAMGLKFFGDHEQFFISAIKQVIRKREKQDTKTYDFPEMCVTLQKNGTMRDPDTGLEMEPTDELLAAQAFFFFIAGVEPTAATMFAVMLELGRNPDIQDRVYKEMNVVLEKYNGQFTYEAIFEMEYLRRVLDESLRMHPPIGFLTRQCVQNSVLPVGNIPVEKGTKIFTPIFDVHHDPKYYPDPEVFDPDRFARDGMSINDPSFMAFGKGNRFCIGARYARLQLLSGIVYMLREYSLKTVVYEGGIRYSKEQMQVRLRNVDVEMIPRLTRVPS